MLRVRDRFEMRGSLRNAGAARLNPHFLMPPYLVHPCRRGRLRRAALVRK